MAARRTVARRKPTRRPKLVLPRPRRGRRLPPGVVRLDYPKVQGYIVRIGYIRTPTGWRPRHKAYFGDVRWGGKTAARRAALAWLEQLIRTGRSPRTPAPPRAKRAKAVRARRRSARAS
jgi:hypothetical protein